VLKQRAIDRAITSRRGRTDECYFQIALHRRQFEFVRGPQSGRAEQVVANRQNSREFQQNRACSGSKSLLGIRPAVGERSRIRIRIRAKCRFPRAAKSSLPRRVSISLRYTYNISLARYLRNTGRSFRLVRGRPRVMALKLCSQGDLDRSRYLIKSPRQPPGYSEYFVLPCVERPDERTNE